MFDLNINLSCHFRKFLNKPNKCAPTRSTGVLSNVFLKLLHCKIDLSWRGQSVRLDYNSYVEISAFSSKLTLISVARFHQSAVDLWTNDSGTLKGDNVVEFGLDDSLFKLWL